MKIAVLIARLLLGLIFVFFGSNMIHPFMPVPPMPDSPATRFSLAIMETHYMVIVGVFMVLGGALLLAGRYIPLGLTLLGPIIVNILMFHTMMMHGAGLVPMPLLVAVLWFIVFYGVRRAFAGIFAARVEA